MLQLRNLKKLIVSAEYLSLEALSLLYVGLPEGVELIYENKAEMVKHLLSQSGKITNVYS